MSQQTFSDRLKSAMEKCNYKQSDLIRIAQDKGIKLGKSQVSQYVSGKTTPRPDVVALLAQILDVREDWLSGASVSAENRHATLNDLVTRSETLNETPITSDELPETSKSEQRNEPISDSQSTTQTHASLRNLPSLIMSCTMFADPLLMKLPAWSVKVCAS